MKNVATHMREERKEHGRQDKCRLTVTLLSSGDFRARLSFQSGMESASADASTVTEALASLDRLLGGAA